MKISTCIVLRNEEKVIERCLESVKLISDEIIVVHDGECTDNSLVIAKKYKARIIQEKYIGEAEYHRPLAYAKAQGDWILQIDADEFLSKNTQTEIPRLIQNENIDAYSFHWPYYSNNKYISKGPFSKTFKPCLFRKSKLYMIGISHEYPRTYGTLVKKTDLHLEHISPYENFSWKQLQTKWSNWARLQSSQIVSIEKAPLYNIADPNSNCLYQGYVKLKKYPLLTGFSETFKMLTIYILRGLISSGLTSYKIACMELIYIWLVRINIYKILYGKNS